MVLKIQINGPVTRSDYNNIIKRSLSHYGQEIANRIGPLVTGFRDSMPNETKNFKFKICLDGTKVVSFNVKGFWGRLTKTKYRVTELGIERHDWRNNFWHYCIRFGNIAAKAICYIVPGAQVAIPYLGGVSCGLGLLNPMIKYEEPIRYNEYETNYTESNKCRHFHNNRTQLLSGCCKELWCCCLCHDLRKIHKWIYAENMVCLMCNQIKYQRFKPCPFTCIYCDYDHNIEAYET